VAKGIADTAMMNTERGEREVRLRLNSDTQKIYVILKNGKDEINAGEVSFSIGGADKEALKSGDYSISWQEASAYLGL